MALAIGVDVGGTKIAGGLVDEQGSVLRTARRQSPATACEAIASAIEDLVAELSGSDEVAGVGVGAAGFVGAARSTVLFAPNLAWRDEPLRQDLEQRLALPVVVENDANAAAWGEFCFGAGEDVDDLLLVTVGTGVGGGAVVGGAAAHGLVHPEMGHLSVPRRPGDDFPGSCPFHADCLEGMAGGAAIAARWGRPAEQLDGEELRRAVELEAAYLTAGLRNIVYTLAPQRIVIGGSVSTLPNLFPLIRANLAALLAAYPALPEHTTDTFVTPATLGPLAGPTGALILAERAHLLQRC